MPGVTTPVVPHEVPRHLKKKRPRCADEIGIAPRQMQPTRKTLLRQVSGCSIVVPAS